MTKHWRAAHAFGTTLPGWLVLLPTTHVETLANLSPDASAELGTQLRALSVALREAIGCTKTYVALFAEAEGFSHLHFVIPRMADQPHELRGPSVFAALVDAPDGALTVEEMDDIAQRVRRRLP